MFPETGSIYDQNTRIRIFSCVVSAGEGVSFSFLLIFNPALLLLRLNGLKITKATRVNIIPPPYCQIKHTWKDFCSMKSWKISICFFYGKTNVYWFLLVIICGKNISASFYMKRSFLLESVKYHKFLCYTEICSYGICLDGVREPLLLHPDRQENRFRWGRHRLSQGAGVYR